LPAEPDDSLLAALAVALQQHFGHATRGGPLADERNGRLEREVGDARDVAAVDA
jgi:hypothetical protein